jgi:hypothetical protein
MVYETIKIYSEKFTTNNSENNYKLSYTPKPHPLHTFTFSPGIIQKHPGKTRTTLPEKSSKQKKVDS